MSQEEYEECLAEIADIKAEINYISAQKAILEMELRQMDAEIEMKERDVNELILLSETFES